MTRMWLLPTRWLCDDHLLGEHAEMHQAAGTIANHPHGRAVIEGHTRDAAPDDVETLLIVARHDALAAEMEERGMDHDRSTRLADFDDPGVGRIGGDDLHANAGELARRCAGCRSRMAAEGPRLHATALSYIAFLQDARPGWPGDAWAFRDDR